MFIFYDLEFYDICCHAHLLFYNGITELPKSHSTAQAGNGVMKPTACIHSLSQFSYNEVSFYVMCQPTINLHPLLMYRELSLTLLTGPRRLLHH
jgi:hypothetical protein